MNRMKKALALFAKTPLLGNVKTRLGVELSDADCLRLHLAFLADVLDAASRSKGASLYVYFSDRAGRQACDGLGLAIPPEFHVRCQRGQDLGQRLAHAFQELFDGGHRAAIIVGSDHPLLVPSQLEEGFDQLRDHDVTLGPTTDGGYYLIGLRRFLPALFREVPWSTADVLSTALERLRDMGWSYALLEEGIDVDTADDLRALAGILASSSAAADLARHTREALDSIDFRLGCRPSDEPI